MGAKPSYRIQELLETLQERGYDPIVEALEALKDPDLAPQDKLRAHLEVAKFVYPRRRESPVKLTLPEGASLSEQGTFVIQLLSAGVVGPEQASHIQKCLESQARLVEARELERRLVELERKLGP